MTSDSRNQLRVCLLLGSNEIPNWFACALQHTESNAPIEFSHIYISNHSEENVEKSILEEILEKRSWILIAVVRKISDLLLGRSSLDSNKSIQQIPCLRDVPIATAVVEESGRYGYEFSPDTIDSISDHSDVAVHFGIGILQGDILEAPSLGVIGFHHGDIRKYRGGPPGFWEFIHGESTTGVTIQRFNETLDGGEILAFESIDISDVSGWDDIRKLQKEASKPMLKEAVHNLEDSSFEPETPDKLGEVYSPSQRNLQTVIHYLWRVISS